MEPKAKVLCVSGSPRARGNTDRLIEKIAEGVESGGGEAEVAYLRNYTIHPCNACEQCRRDKICSEFLDGMHLIYPKIEESTGLVIGSPTYNYNVTSEVKSFIDRLYPYFDFETPRPGPYHSRLAGQGRSAVVLGVCEQNEESEMGFTMPAMAYPLEVIGYSIVEKVAVTGHFPRGSVKKDEEALGRAFEAGKRLAQTFY